MIFIEPHGLSHEGPEHPKVQFHKTIKDIEKRLGGDNLSLESFIVTPTRLIAIRDRGLTRQQWADLHVMFMHEAGYLDDLFARI